MESENGKITNGDLKKSSSSSSSPDSPLEDPFQEDGTIPNKSKLEEDAQLASDQTTESPTTQVMERSGDSPYRIPPSVFAGTNSTAPMEWSTASNESLFSIHTGNMSFTKDQFLLRSGELGMPGEPPSTSGHMFNYSGNLSLAGITTDSGKSCELVVAVETMKEVLRENAEDQSNANSLAERRISRRSEESGTSTKSFAFPILAGDREKGRSAKKDGSVNVVSETPKSQPQLQPHPQAPHEAEPKTPAAVTPNAAQTKWFPCLSCCPFRSRERFG